MLTGIRHKAVLVLRFVLLVLVGDSADGIPGIPRWGAKASAQILGRYVHIERIPVDESEWVAVPRGARALSESLEAHREEAMLYKRLATLRVDVPLPESLADLHWRGVPRPEYHELCTVLGFERLMELPHRWADGDQPT